MPSVCQGACVKLCSLVVIRHSMLLSPAAAAAGSVFFNWSFFPYYTAYGKERQGSAFQKPRYFSFFLLDTSASGYGCKLHYTAVLTGQGDFRLIGVDHLF